MRALPESRLGLPRLHQQCRNRGSVLERRPTANVHLSHGLERRALLTDRPDSGRHRRLRSDQQLGHLGRLGLVRGVRAVQLVQDERAHLRLRQRGRIVRGGVPRQHGLVSGPVLRSAFRPAGKYSRRPAEAFVLLASDRRERPDRGV